MRILLGILVCLFLAGCKSGTVPSQSIDWNKNWYKRYTGTVAGQQVIVYIYYATGDKKEEDGLGVPGSNYRYKNKQDIISLGFAKMKNGKLLLTEEAPGTQGGTTAAWSLVVNDDGAKGRRTWHNKKTDDIDLKEDYSGGSYPLDIISSDDRGFSNSAKVEREIMLMVPGPGMNNGDAAFLERSLLHMVGGDTMHLKNMSAYLAAEIKQFKKDKRNGDERTMHLSCICNENGLLQFELTNYVLPDGAAHGSYWSTNSCIDVQKKKIWHLSDIMLVDTERISNLLNAKAGEFFKLAAGDDLANYLLVDQVPPTENFIISNTGITFCYSPAEIAGFAYGDITLSIPFSQIQPLLKPEFKSRMNL